MKKLMLLTVVAVAVSSQAGCQTCRRMGSWFHRGDQCGQPQPTTCPPGGPQTTFMMPGSPQVLPGPDEIAPAN